MNAESVTRNHPPRSLANPSRLALAGPAPSLRLDALARVLGAAASRHSVLGALFTSPFAPRLPPTGAVAKQAETCPCPDPPCFLRAWGRDPSAAGQFAALSGVAMAPAGRIYVAASKNRRIQSFCVAARAEGVSALPRKQRPARLLPHVWQGG